MGEAVPERSRTPKVGVVVIGRNEGPRLVRCLSSVAQQEAPFVYVDSGSTDGSVSIAREMGAGIVELDMSVPFTAARARNAGFSFMRRSVSDLSCVQFVDGDCELADNWMKTAASFLATHEDIAVVCGRLRERQPSSSIYNLLCDMEWDTPEGSADACGGIAMMRASAFESMNGFREDLIAGEEPELCVRLRKSAWRVWRLSDEMATHDAAMIRFGQWWRRSIRAGYAFAQGAHLHGQSPERHAMRESRSAWFWGLGIPIAVSVCMPWFGGWSLLLLLLYPVQAARIASRGRRSAHENWLYAIFLMIAKFAELFGQFKYLAHMAGGTRSRLIEYK